MKKSINMLRNVFPVLTGLFLMLFLFAACNKDHIDYNQPVVPASGLMAFNLSPDQPAVAVDVSSARLSNTALGYTNYTGSYLPVYTGSHEVRFFDFNSGSTLAFNNTQFADSGYYSTFLMGANGNYRNVIVEDKLIPLTAASGKAWVRYVNAIPDTNAVSVINIGTAGDNTISDSTRYASVSNFVQVNAGQVSTSVNDGSDIAANRTITLDENKVYTLLFVGLPSATDTSKAVQIRFIQNGTITP
ncbi:MAG: DUF4397 domain-containing protein [Ferruginibacter sp.]